MYRNDQTRNQYRQSSPSNPYETPPSHNIALRIPPYHHHHVRPYNRSPMSMPTYRSPSPINHRFDNSPVLNYCPESPSWHTPKSWDSSSRRSSCGISNATYSGGTHQRKHNFSNSSHGSQLSHLETNTSRNSDIRNYINSSMLENPWCELEQDLEKEDNLERLTMANVM